MAQPHFPSDRTSPFPSESALLPSSTHVLTMGPLVLENIGASMLLLSMQIVVVLQAMGFCSQNRRVPVSCWAGMIVCTTLHQESFQDDL